MRHKNLKERENLLGSIFKYNPKTLYKARIEEFKMPKNSREKKFLGIISSIGLPIDDGTYWWIHNPERAVEEIARMGEISNAVMSVRGDKLIWEETVTGDTGEKFIITIAAGSDYPFSLPQVEVFSSKSDIVGTIKDKLIYEDEPPFYIFPFSCDSNTSILTHRNVLIAWCGICQSYIKTALQAKETYSNN